MPDISDTLAPKSDQLDAIDLMGRPPQIFTVTRVDVKTDAEQPVSIHLAEFPRVWRPSKGMRRVLAHCWGRESSHWTPDHYVELFCDERVKFGNDVTGGTRISRISHIAKTTQVPVLLSKGRSGAYTVEPLPEGDIKIAVLRHEWHSADAERRTAITAEVQQLTGAQS